MKRELDPIVGQFPDQNKIRCRDCIFRLKIPFADKDIGPMNAYCHTYTKENSDGKPIDILFKNTNCKYYEKDPSKK